DLGSSMLGKRTFPGVGISTAKNNIRRSLRIGSTFSGANAGVYQNQYTYGTSLNWVLGRHTVYAGFNWDHNQLKIINNENNAAGVSCSALSDLLAGNVTAGSNTRYTLGASNRYMRADIAGAFLQDNIRLTSRFNLFFFQAEDGIRDWSVTGVQTCALPI